MNKALGIAEILHLIKIVQHASKCMSWTPQDDDGVVL